MEKVNVAELLENCPKGMELYSPIFGKVYLDKIRPHLAIRVTTDKEQSDIKEEFLYDGRYGINGECMLFPSKDKTSWEGFHRPFVDVDVAITNRGDIHLLRTADSSYCAYRARWEGLPKFDNKITTDIEVLRLATEEEKKRLLQAIKDNGYKWDAERKCLIELPKFKNGDILAAGDWVFIFKELHTNGSPRCYCHYDLTLEEFKVDTNSYMAYGGDIYLATKEQQDLLFSKMEGAGYKWNAEKKCLEKLGKERFDISTLKPFDKVLVRNSNDGDWACDLFSHLRHEDSLLNKFRCIGVGYKYCIPFEGNEHLCGTSEDCDEFYKTWEE